jgi:serine/threonine-protein kinase
MRRPILPDTEPASAQSPSVLPTTPPRKRSPTGTPSATQAPLRGYRVTELIGRGGMGEVVLAHDEDIGRDVAVKRIHRDQGNEALVRFVREAQIQARLEHPGIVPVYEIGKDEDGQPFFSMKRLAGRNLGELLHQDPRPPHQRLVRAFAEICRTIDYVHTRGVIHRDLKPANVVVGEFGEIYVLDWGLARMTGEDEPVTEDGETEPTTGVTRADAILGTPGYMAPEQIRDARAVTPACDVYALGSILFEILAREPLHLRGMAALDSTAAGIDGSPARRRPELDVPPELDAACIAALEVDPAKRPSARELAERVERYLDGDRDLERRRALAAEHLAVARAALRDDDVKHRADAARAAGRALALDPESAEAAALVNQLLFQIPSELPPELEAVLAAGEASASRRQSRLAVAAYCAVLGCVVAAGLNGVLDWTWWWAVCGMAAVLMIVTVRNLRRVPSAGFLLGVVIVDAVLAGFATRGFGSLIIVPGMLVIMAQSFVAYPQLQRRAGLVIGILAASWLVPVTLELTGVIPRSWSFREDGILSTTTTLVLGGTSTTVLMIGVHVTLVVVTGLYANRLARSRSQVLRETKIREWHLRQLVSSRSATSSQDR